MKNRFLLALLLFAGLLMALLPAGATDSPTAWPQVTLTLSKPTLSVGDTQTLSWTITGGDNGPYYPDWIIWSCVSEGSYYDTPHSLWPTDVSSSQEQAVEGKCHVSLRIRDADRNVRFYYSEQFTVTGTTAIAPLEVSVSLDKTSVTVGTPIKATVQLKGGLPPYRIRGSWQTTDNIGQPSEMMYYSDAEFEGVQSTYKPTFGEKLRFYVSATDACGQWDEAMVADVPITDVPHLTITQSLQINGLEVTPDPCALGSPLKASWQVVGGEAPYTVSGRWFIEKGYDDHEWFSAVIENDSSTFTPTYGDEGRFELTVTDARGRQMSRSAYFYLEGRPTEKEMSVAIQIDKSVRIGAPVTAGWQIAGGKPPYTVTGTWNIDVPGIVGYVETPAEIQDDTSSFSPDRGVKGFLFLNIRDASGRNKMVATPEFLIIRPGDANGNQAVDLDDLILMLDHVLGLGKVKDFTNANMNNNGSIDLNDLLLLIDRLL